MINTQVKLTFITALIPETFQVLIFKLYFIPSVLSLSQSKYISFKLVSVLLIIGLFSVLAFLATGSSFPLALRLFLETDSFTELTTEFLIAALEFLTVSLLISFSATLVCFLLDFSETLTDSTTCSVEDSPDSLLESEFFLETVLDDFLSLVSLLLDTLV